jgi:hypothetical protein
MEHTVKISKAHVIENLRKELAEVKPKLDALLAEKTTLVTKITDINPLAKAELLSKSPEKWLEQFKVVDTSSFWSRIRPKNYTTYTLLGNRYNEGDSYEYVLKDTKEYFDDFLKSISLSTPGLWYRVSHRLRHFFQKANLKFCDEAAYCYNTLYGIEPEVRTLSCEVERLTTSINLLENSIDDYIEHAVYIPSQYTCENKK